MKDNIVNLFDSDEDAEEGADDIDDVLAEAANPHVVDPPGPAPKFDRPARVTTHAQEIQVEQMPGHVAADVVQLLAVWGDKGQVFVAKAVNGTPVEQYRKPTVQEWELLKTNGRMVKGGLAAASIPETTPKSVWPKVLIGGLAIAAAGVGAWWYAKKREDSMDEDVDELD